MMIIWYSPCIEHSAVQHACMELWTRNLYYVDVTYRTTKIDTKRICNNFQVTVAISIVCCSSPTNTTTNTSKCIFKTLTFWVLRDQVEYLKQKTEYEAWKDDSSGRARDDTCFYCSSLYTKAKICEPQPQNLVVLNWQVPKLKYAYTCTDTYICMYYMCGVHLYLNACMYTYMLHKEWQ